MELFQKFKEGLKKTQAKLTHELKRIFTGSPKLTPKTIEELEAALLGADLGIETTTKIIETVKKEYETQGSKNIDVFEIAKRHVELALINESTKLKKSESGLTVISLVGVNGTGKTTTAAKLAYLIQKEGQKAMIAACDTFRAAAIEQVKLWGQRLNIPVISNNYGSDPAAVAHDAVSAALARKIDYLIIDTAGRLHTKHNLMQELQKVHKVIARQLTGAPHETLLVLDATTGMNAIIQAREFNKAVNLTGLIITKLDGTSKGGMAVAIQNELKLPIKFVGLGEKPEDLQPFVPSEFAAALFESN
jgi:fused signal recognition particle receptor